MYIQQIICQLIDSTWITNAISTNLAITDHLTIGFDKLVKVVATNYLWIYDFEILSQLSNCLKNYEASVNEKNQ